MSKKTTYVISIGQTNTISIRYYYLYRVVFRRGEGMMRGKEDKKAKIVTLFPLPKSQFPPTKPQPVISEYAPDFVKHIYLFLW